jgi:hypothetical protein
MAKMLTQENWQMAILKLKKLQEKQKNLKVNSLSAAISFESGSYEKTTKFFL